MTVERLKNYGRPFSETMTTLPGSLRRRVRREGMRVIREEVGLLGLLRIALRSGWERRRLRRTSLDAVRERGLQNQAFIDLIVGQTALFVTTAKTVGMERALAIHHAIMDRVAGPLNEALLPARSELQALEDPFAALRQYMLAFFAAERGAGLHEYRVVEDSERALAVDVTYCAFCEIPKQLGIMQACEPGCYSDEVFFPGFLRPFGIRFVRTQTLARGGSCCDFRFERIAEQRVSSQ